MYLLICLIIYWSKMSLKLSVLVYFALVSENLTMNYHDIKLFYVIDWSSITYKILNSFSSFPLCSFD